MYEERQAQQAPVAVGDQTVIIFPSRVISDRDVCHYFQHPYQMSGERLQRATQDDARADRRRDGETEG